jgi:pyruvate dehydrogenase E1 component
MPNLHNRYISAERKISQKKLGLEQVAKFAERFDIPVTKEDVKQLNFYKPAQDSEEMTYMNQTPHRLH